MTGFFHGLSLTKVWRRATYAVVVCLLLTTVKMTESEDDLSDIDPDANITNSSTLLCPVSGLPCDELINYALCISCNLTEAEESCQYGKNVTATCQPREGVNCTVCTGTEGASYSVRDDITTLLVVWGSPACHPFSSPAPTTCRYRKRSVLGTSVRGWRREWEGGVRRDKPKGDIGAGVLPSPAQVPSGGNATFNRTFTCQYCYQLPDDQQCCEPNDTCQVHTPLANPTQ